MPELEPTVDVKGHRDAAAACTRCESGAHPCAVPDFDAVYDEFFDTVWRTLRAIGVPPLTLDDAVQDVFFAVHRQLPSFEARSSVKTWICRIACHIAANYRRRERRKGGLLPLDPALSLGDPSPHDKLEQTRAWAFVSAFLEGLDTGKRTVYVLSRLEGLSAPEIAESLAIPVNTVYSRIHSVEIAFKSFIIANGHGGFP